MSRSGAPLAARTVPSPSSSAAGRSTPTAAAHTRSTMHAHPHARRRTGVHYRVGRVGLRDSAKECFSALAAFGLWTTAPRGGAEALRCSHCRDDALPPADSSSHSAHTCREYSQCGGYCRASSSGHEERMDSQRQRAVVEVPGNMPRHEVRPPQTVTRQLLGVVSAVPTEYPLSTPEYPLSTH